MAGADAPAFTIVDVAKVTFGRDTDGAGAPFCFADYVLRGDTGETRIVLTDRAYVLNEFGSTIDSFAAEAPRR